MDYKKNIGVTKYNGNFVKMLKKNSKVLEMWPAIMRGAMAEAPENESPIPSIYMEDVFVGKAELKDLAERKGCATNTYHCVKGTEYATIYLTHTISMYEELDNCSIELYSTANAESKSNLRKKSLRVLELMTSEIINRFDNAILNVINTTAPRLLGDETITVDNVLQKIKDLGAAIHNDPDFPVDKKSDIEIVIPSRYETMVDTAVIKAFGAGYMLKKEDLVNGTRVTKWDGYTIRYWQDATYMFSSTKRAVQLVFACFNSLEAIQTYSVKKKTQFDAEFHLGAGYPVQYLEGEDSTPIIKEIVVAYEKDVAKGDVPAVVQAPNENEGLRIFPRGTEEAYVEAKKAARTAMKAKELSSVLYDITVDRQVEVADGTAVDKAYLIANANLKVMDSTGKEVTNEANVIMNPTTVTPKAGDQVQANIVVKNEAGGMTVQPIVIIGK